MDVRQLRYLVRTVQSGSISAAAEGLFVTRAALSKSLAQLESELGYDLLVRDRAGVALTEAGRRFYSRIVELVERFDALETDMRLDSGVVNVTVGVPTSWFSFFEERLRRLGEAYSSEMRLTVVSAADAEVVRRLERGEFDMAITHLRLADTFDDGCCILRTPLFIAMSSRNSLASREFVTEGDLETQEVYYYTCGFDDVFWVPTLRGAHGHFENDLMFIYSRVHRNEGVLPTPLHTVPEFQSDIVLKPFQGERDVIQTYCYISRVLHGDARKAVLCQKLRHSLAALEG